MTDKRGATGWKPKLGLLPPIPDRPVLMLRPTVAVLPAPPPEVHNLEKIEDPDMLGNDKHGDCVAVGIEIDRRASRAAMGLPLNKLTAAQVVANYFAMTGGPDSGLVAQLALEWVHKNGWPGCDDKLLCFARVNPTLTPIRQTIAEFCSGLFCVEIDASESYPSTYWNADNSAYEGGHGVATGTYTQAYTVVRSWGYDARMTPSFVTQKVGEFDVLVWDFQWNALTYERQTQLVADYEALTGKTWAGPTPAPPAPTTSRSAVNITAISPVRLLDSRSGNGLSGKFFAHAPRSVVIAGRSGIPANATMVWGTLTVANPATKGNAEVGPDPIAYPSTSTLNFKAGDELASLFVSALRADGTLALVLGDGTTADLIADIRAFGTP